MEFYKEIKLNNRVVTKKRRTRSTRSKKASYSKSPKTIYKDSKKTIQIVIKKVGTKRKKKK
jgi:hypothetical protein